MKNLLFLDIDTQKDFMNATGKLYVPGAEEIKPNLKKIVDCVKTSNYYMLSSLDTHNENDPEFELYNPHCIRGSEGCEKVDETFICSALMVNNAVVNYFPENRRHYLIEKNTFDVFSNPDTEKILKRLNPEEVIVFGVATDVCVKVAVNGLLSRNYSVTILVDAIKGLDESSCQNFLDSVKISNVKLLTTDDAMKGMLCESLLLK